MEKLLRVAEMRDLEKQVTKGEISYSRMVEIINEKHFLKLVELRQSLAIQKIDKALEQGDEAIKRLSLTTDDELMKTEQARAYLESEGLDVDKIALENKVKELEKQLAFEKDNANMFAAKADEYRNLNNKNKKSCYPTPQLADTTKEAEALKSINEMCIQSLSPEQFDKWEEVRTWLEINRNINPIKL